MSYISGEDLRKLILFLAVLYKTCLTQSWPWNFLKQTEHGRQNSLWRSHPIWLKWYRLSQDHTERDWFDFWSVQDIFVMSIFLVSLLYYLTWLSLCPHVSATFCIFFFLFYLSLFIFSTSRFFVFWSFHFRILFFLVSFLLVSFVFLR